MDVHPKDTDLEKLSLENKRALLHHLIQERLKKSNSYELSFSQQRLWFFDAVNPGSSVYNIPVAVMVRGKLHYENIERSLYSIVRRHESLRTNFVTPAGVPQLLISGDCRIDFEVVDLMHVDSSKRDQEALQQIHDDIEIPFDLQDGPLFRVRLYKVDGDKHFIVIVMHHIISDGWSMGVFCRELTSFYTAYENNSHPELDPLPMQYSSFATEQRRQLNQDKLDKLISFWREHLKGAPPLFQLSTYGKRLQRSTFKGGNVPFWIDALVTQRMKALGHQVGASLHMVTLAIISVLLNKHSGREDIVIGIASAGRNNKDIESLVGFFANLLPARFTIDPSDTFKQTLEKTQNVSFDVFEHQDMPFDKLVEELAPERDAGYHPVVQVGVSFMNDQMINTSLLGLESEQVVLSRDISRFDLDFTLRETTGGIKGFVMYNAALYEESIITSLVENFHILIDRILSEPEIVIGALSIISDHDKHLLNAWNATDEPFEDDKTIHQLFELQVARTPRAVAVVYNEHSLTYEDLQEKSNRLASHLRKIYRERHGGELHAGVLIALYLDRGLELIIGILAVLKAGGAYVPIQPGCPQQRLDYMLENTGSKIILSQNGIADRFIITPHSDKLVYIDLSESLYNEGVAELPTQCRSSDPAYVIYTSGTTGKPKGVVVQHRSVNNLIQNQVEVFGIRESDIALLFASYAFDASVSEIFTALTTGACLCIIPDKIRYDSKLTAEFIKKERVNVATIPPALLGAMPYEDLPDLRTLVVAGETCPADVISKWSVGRRLINAYGPTECTVCVSMNIYREGDSNTNIGFPIRNARVYVLDSNLTPVAIGNIGELYVGGALLARGYLDPDATIKRFIQNPFVSEEDKEKGYINLYRTGDLVRWHFDGRLEYIGRNDDQVKINGYRIELTEIEHALSLVPGIAQCCVLVREKKRVAGCIRYLAGYYTVNNHAHQVDQAFVAQALSKSLPEYMIPSTLLQMNSFPLTINGKLDKSAFPDPGELSTVDDSSAPITELELAMCKIWEEILGVERVRTTDDFFRIGGSSILAIQLSHQMSEALDNDVSVADIFNLKTVDSIIRKFGIKGDGNVELKI